MSTFTVPTFPYAQQAQIIRANQRDIYHVSNLREQTDSVLRSWLGTRWLTRWAKEVELVVKLVYYGLTTARATQTLGEEYTAIWPSSSLQPRSKLSRAALVLLPTLPGYLLSRCTASETLASRFPHFSLILKRLPSSLEVLAELNLAVFYLQGVYYSLSNRIFKIRHISSVPENPHVRPPSYALLGVMLAVRLFHRLVVFLRTRIPAKGLEEDATHPTSDAHETFLDKRAVSLLLGPEDPEGVPAKPAEEDERTMLDISTIPPALRASRNCTLCLEERTDTCSTECGHLFCWSCIVGWGREKAECPLCRQSLSLTRLIPIYNL